MYSDLNAVDVVRPHGASLLSTQDLAGSNMNVRLSGLVVLARSGFRPQSSPENG